MDPFVMQVGPLATAEKPVATVKIPEESLEFTSSTN
jgi:hypothetical protein